MAAPRPPTHGFGRGKLGFVFLDHAKEAYLPDLELLLEHGWLRPGAIVVADNVRVPRCPEYHEYMKREEGTRAGGPASTRRTSSTKS